MYPKLQFCMSMNCAFNKINKALDHPSSDGGTRVCQIFANITTHDPTLVVALAFVRTILTLCNNIGHTVDILYQIFIPLIAIDRPYK